MPRNLVLFDLEWNIGYQPYTFNYHGVQQTFRGEIVEIGAVKIDEDANVLDTFSIHLRPRIFRKLQHHIAKVTGLTQADLDKGEPIVQGLRRFMQWCGPDAEFAEWGMDDVPVLKQNLFLCNIDESRPTVWYDLQQVFLREHPRKEGEGMTLESVVTRMGIPMERQFHDALSDTLYTADVCRLLDLRAGLAAYPTEDESLQASLCQAPGEYRDFEVFHGYVEQYAWRTDPKIYTMNCPECGTALTPDDVWLKKGSNSWYTLSQCPHCAGSGNAVSGGVFQRYKLARRDGLHWSFARCLQLPDEALLGPFHCPPYCLRQQGPTLPDGPQRKFQPLFLYIFPLLQEVPVLFRFIGQRVVHTELLRSVHGSVIQTGYTISRRLCGRRLEQKGLGKRKWNIRCCSGPISWARWNTGRHCWTALVIWGRWPPSRWPWWSRSFRRCRSLPSWP